MVWEDEYALGISVVDAQPKQLFRISDELDNTLTIGIKAEEIDPILVRIGEYAARHISMEEKYMAESNYPGRTELQDAHKAITVRFAELYENFRNNGPSQ